MSAILSKLVSFLRDRLLLDIFPTEKVDIVFAAFRIPDFFYYLFVGATISIIFLPRVIELKEKEKIEYFSSFLWGVLFLFGGLSLVGIFSVEYLVQFFAKGFDKTLQGDIATLSQFLFGSVFLLSLSGVFAAFLQAKQKFISIALAPLFYMGGICTGLFLFRDSFGLLIIGYSAIFGAALHLFANLLYFFFSQGRVGFYWKKPISAWKNFQGDFWRRVLNNSAFQINQSADILIASFLITGSITAFSIGTNLGHFLLSIVGFSVANSAFPRLTKHKFNWSKQQSILKSALKWILFFSIPATIFALFFLKEILKLGFGLSGSPLEMTQTVFFWTVLSLPAACMIPILSRVFLANDDTSTPLWINFFSLLSATGLAAYLALVVFPPEKAILGLALGNFTANFLTLGLFWFFLQRKIATAADNS